MPKYTVYLVAGASAAMTVEADTEDEAIDQAFDAAPTLCARCSGWGQGYGLDLDDWELAADDAVEVAE